MGCTSRIPRAMSLPPDSTMSLSLARATSRSSLCQRARVSSCPSPRRGTRGWASRPRWLLSAMAERSHLGLDAQPLVPLLGDGQLDTLALWQRDERLVALANDKDIVESGGKDMALGILDVHNVEGSRVLLPGDHGSPC